MRTEKWASFKIQLCPAGRTGVEGSGSKTFSSFSQRVTVGEKAMACLTLCAPPPPCASVSCNGIARESDGYTLLGMRVKRLLFLLQQHRGSAAEQIQLLVDCSFHLFPVKAVVCSALTFSPSSSALVF